MEQECTFEAIARKAIARNDFKADLSQERNSISFKEEETRQKRPEPINTGCSKCGGFGYNLTKGKSYIVADECNCISEIEHSSGGWTIAQKIRQRGNYLNSASIPNRYLKPLEGELDPHLTEWFSDFIQGKEVNNFLFFYGDTGTGKTHTACHLLLQSLFDGLDDYAAYLPLHEVFERRNSYLDCRFSKDQKEKIFHKQKYEVALDLMRSSRFLVIDELGQEKLSTDERKILFKILDDRYSQGKPTVLISNHCDTKGLSLENKKLSSLVGKRIASRLKSSLQIHFKGVDRRLSEGSELFTRKEIKEFKVPDKILTLDDNTHQIMTWLARNPAFEQVATRKRSSLTYVNPAGEKEDKDRPEVSFYKDVWTKGTTLQISGPICDHDDRKLYAVLLSQLKNQHKDGRVGLQLTSTLLGILKIAGLTNTGSNIAKLKRQLNRLTRMSLTFRSQNGSRWDGPLITGVLYDGKTKDSRVIINFSHFMISFYRLHEYTTFMADKLKMFKGDSSAFYIFYQSHTSRSMKVSVDRCRELLGIPSSFNKKEARKRVKKAIDDLIFAGVMSEHGTFIKNGIVYTCLA